MFLSSVEYRRDSREISEKNFSKEMKQEKQKKKKQKRETDPVYSI